MNMEQAKQGLEFRMERGVLVRELGLALGAIEKRVGVSPVLGNVRFLEKEGGWIEVAATDLEVWVHSLCAAEVRRAGSGTLPAKRLLDYLRLLPEGEVEFRFSEKHWASIASGRSRALIAGIDAEEFPELPQVSEARCEVPFSVLDRSVQRVIYAIAQEESRFTLNGALLNISADALGLVATDGRRLALVEEPVPAPGVMKPWKGLVSRKALLELRRWDGVVDGGEKVVISADERNIAFSVQGRVLVSRILSGSFPDYGRVLPKAFKGQAVMEREAFLGVLKRVYKFADDRSRRIKLTLSEGSITAASSTSDVGESEESLPAQVDGVLLTIAFNAQYLMDFLESTKASSVILKWNDSNSAVQFEPAESDGGRYLSIVMPMRIG